MTLSTITPSAAKSWGFANRKTTLLRLGDLVLRGEVNDDEVAGLIAEAYQKNHCDGLFLTAVSNLGVRLPVRKAIRAIEASSEVRFVVLDGAQDLGHMGPDLGVDCADLYFAGAHKWLGAYLPLGMAFYSQLRSRGMVDAVLRDSLTHGLIDDPLLRFVERLPGGVEETVNLSPIFSAQGAVSDASLPSASPEALLPTRLQNAEAVSNATAALDWRPQTPHPSLRSAVLLLQAESTKARSFSSEQLRLHFHRFGIALTAYERGRIRLSMPAAKLESTELDWLLVSLQNAS